MHFLQNYFQLKFNRTDLWGLVHKLYGWKNVSSRARHFRSCGITAQELLKLCYQTKYDLHNIDKIGEDYRGM